MGRKANKKQGKGKAEDPIPVLPSFRDAPMKKISITDVSKFKKSRESGAGRVNIPRLRRMYGGEPRCFFDPDNDTQMWEKLAFHHRFFRSHYARNFATDYKFARGRKICISSKRLKHFTPTGEYCFDSSWVSVHGVYTICMVTRRKPVDMTRLSSYYRARRNEMEALLDFPEAVISEVECIPYNDFEYNDEILRRLCGSKVVKPFGVVSLVQTAEKNWEEAIDPVSNFLEQKMKDSSLAFTDYETVQTAIGGFQHICGGQELRAEDIWVTILDVLSGQFNHLDMDIITEQLEVVNGRLSHTKYLETPLVLRRPMLPTPL